MLVQMDPCVYVRLGNSAWGHKKLLPAAFGIRQKEAAHPASDTLALCKEREPDHTMRPDAATTADMHPEPGPLQSMESWGRWGFCLPGTSGYCRAGCA